MTTPQQQWSAIMDQIIREMAVAAKYRADVMNFSGAATNAKTEAEAADTRVSALYETIKMLTDDFKRRGLQFIDDEWMKP